jgi:transcription antitermination factor NusG
MDSQLDVLCNAGADGRWYALVVRPKHEKAVNDYLGMRGLDAFCPVYRTRRRWSDRMKEVDLPLFAGYVFCRFSYEQRLAALGTPGVRSVVTVKTVPQAISESEIQALQSIGKSGLPAKPWPFLRTGQRVRIELGSLAGLEGILVREKDLFRVVVSVELLMRSVAVEVDRDSIYPLSESKLGKMRGA